MLGLILSNANVAAMDISDASSEATVAAALKDVEASARRAALLFGLAKAFNRRG